MILESKEEKLTEEKLRGLLADTKRRFLCLNFIMDRLKLTGQNLGRVLFFRFDHLHAEHFLCYQVKLPNLKLKTQPKQLPGSLPLVIALPDFIKSWSNLTNI
jgi:hypothetical protein